MFHFITVPHFLIFHKDKYIEDYSLDPEKSPSVSYTYPNPFNAVGACAIFYETEMKVILRHKAYLGQYFEWYIGNEATRLLPDHTKDIDRGFQWPCAVSHEYGKMVIYHSK